jgi:hypothetical protein
LCQCLPRRDLDSAYRYGNPSRYVFNRYGRSPTPQSQLRDVFWMLNQVANPNPMHINSNVLPNEKEISHGRVSWQERLRSLDQGPLASSIG